MDEPRIEGPTLGGRIVVGLLDLVVKVVFITFFHDLFSVLFREVVAPCRRYFFGS